MERRASLALTLGLGLLAAAGAPVAGFHAGSLESSYRDGPPPGHTGGFGEPTCRACHFDESSAGGEGTLRVVGFPERFVSDSTYTVRVELTRDGMATAGFQLAIRRQSSGGPSAGVLTSASSRVQVIEGEEGRVQYAQQTLGGTDPGGDGVATWELRWRAPARCSGVVLHVAGNAANGDNSEFGDHILTRRLRSEARCAGTAERGSGGDGRAR